MKIKRLQLEKFTAFEDATFEFAEGVNVLIGENATGKSHVLKLLYVVNEAVRLVNDGGGMLGGVDRFDDLSEAVRTLLLQTFLPDDLGRLVRRARGRRSASMHLAWSNGASVDITLSNLGKVTTRQRGQFSDLGRTIFLPPREVLSIFPGFVASWQKRESNFDRSYYDLCVALEAKPLRGPRDEQRAPLLAPIEGALEGVVVQDKGRFYIALKDGNLEAPLVAEGLRKLGVLYHLLRNGSLQKNAFLFWDEPEANMNPKLAHLLAALIAQLAASGIQVLAATHDYALMSELSLTGSGESNAFFGLVRTDTGVVVGRGARAIDLPDNPILDALADLHGRELAEHVEP